MRKHGIQLLERSRKNRKSDVICPPCMAINFPTYINYRFMSERNGLTIRSIETGDEAQLGYKRELVMPNNGGSMAKNWDILRKCGFRFAFQEILIKNYIAME